MKKRSMLKSVFGKLVLSSFLFTVFPVIVAGFLINFSYQQSLVNFFENHKNKNVVEAGKEFLPLMTDIGTQSLLTLFIVIILSLFGSILLARNISKPIRRLDSGTKKVTKGNFDVRVKIYDNDEIGELTKRFNKMVEKLKEQISLEEQKQVLEVQVSARTKEIEEMNEKLENEVQERTKELNKKIKEYEKMSKLMVGRELRMMEMKKELKELREKKEKNENSLD